MAEQYPSEEDKNNNDYLSQARKYKWQILLVLVVLLVLVNYEKLLSAVCDNAPKKLPSLLGDSGFNIPSYSTSEIATPAQLKRVFKYMN